MRQDRSQAHAHADAQTFYGAAESAFALQLTRIANAMKPGARHRAEGMATSAHPPGNARSRQPRVRSCVRAEWGQTAGSGKFLHSAKPFRKQLRKREKKQHPKSESCEEELVLH